MSVAIRAEAPRLDLERFGGWHHFLQKLQTVERELEMLESNASLPSHSLTFADKKSAP